jgi:hypothetical protein
MAGLPQSAWIRKLRQLFNEVVETLAGDFERRPIQDTGDTPVPPRLLTLHDFERAVGAKALAKREVDIEHG